MKIRSFVAESVAAALKQVRSEMGGSAVVLKTSRVIDAQGQEGFEVTACLDEPVTGVPGSVTNRMASAPELPIVETHPDTKTAIVAVANSSVELRLTDIEERIRSLMQVTRATEFGFNRVAEVISRTVDALTAADVPASFITAFLNDLRENHQSEKITDTLVREELARRIKPCLEPLKPKVGDKLLFVGPVGSGKTSVIGRLAAQLVAQDKLPIKLVTLDSSKIGGIDEMESYGELLGIKVAHPAQALKAADDADHVVLIDTAGLPSDDARLSELADLCGQLQPTFRIMVLSAQMRSSEVADAVERSLVLAPTHLVLTMTDLTNRWGGALAAVERGNLKISMMSQSPSGNGRMVSPELTTITARLLGREVNCG